MEFVDIFSLIFTRIMLGPFSPGSAKTDVERCGN